jgi:hypothetical protein
MRGYCNFKVVHLALIICVFVLVLTTIYEGNTVRAQQQLIRDMVRNPQCLLPN